MHELLLLAQETPPTAPALVFGYFTVTELMALLGALGAAGAWVFTWVGKRAAQREAHELELERLRLEVQRDKLSEAIADADEHGQAEHVKRALEHKLTPIERSELAEVKRKTTERRTGLGS